MHVARFLCIIILLDYRKIASTTCHMIDHEIALVVPFSTRALGAGYLSGS